VNWFGLHLYWGRGNSLESNYYVRTKYKYYKEHKKVSAKGCISWDPDSAKSCNSQESSKLLYGMEERETEDWVDLLMTQGVSLSL
jgi:hypothetical protein